MTAAAIGSASHGHTNTPGRLPTQRWARAAPCVAARTMTVSTSIWTRGMRADTMPGVSAAAAATHIATGAPNSMSELKMMTKTGGMIARSDAVGACTLRHDASIAASTRQATSGIRSVVIQPARRGRTVAPMKTAASPAAVDREGRVTIQAGVPIPARQFTHTE